MVLDPVAREELAPIFSNRSASFLKLSKVSQALLDAEKCVELKPGWDKAHFRKAAALEAADDDDSALKALEVGEMSALKQQPQQQTDESAESFFFFFFLNVYVLVRYSSRNLSIFFSHIVAFLHESNSASATTRAMGHRHR